MVKGVILAGGTGSRLRPLTKVTNKHLLPVYNEPMIYYPLKKLVDAGIKDILIVTGFENAGDFMRLLGSGSQFGVDLTYKIQDEAGGIAQALGLAEHFVSNDKVVIILGDNIFEDDITPYVKDFMKQKTGARIFLKDLDIEEAKRFGIALIDKGRVTYVEEKPEYPKSTLCHTGLYMFDSQVFRFIKKLKPSHRGEIEIMDVIDMYVKKDECYYDIVKGFWSDAGTFESLLKASQLVKNGGKVFDRRTKN